MSKERNRDDDDYVLRFRKGGGGRVHLPNLVSKKGIANLSDKSWPSFLGMARLLSRSILFPTKIAGKDCVPAAFDEMYSSQ